MIAAIAYITSPFSLIATATILLGLIVTAAQAGINYLASSVYPTSSVTPQAWAGPSESATLDFHRGTGARGLYVEVLRLETGPHLIVLSTVIPALLAAAAVMVSAVIGEHGPNTYNPEAFKAEAADVAEVIWSLPHECSVPRKGRSSNRAVPVTPLQEFALWLDRHRCYNAST